MVEQSNSDRGTVELWLWNSRTSEGGTEEQRNNWAFDGGKVQHLTVEQWNRYGETVELRWWNSVTEMVELWNI